MSDLSKIPKTGFLVLRFIFCFLTFILILVIIVYIERQIERYFTFVSLLFNS